MKAIYTPVFFIPPSFFPVIKEQVMIMISRFILIMFLALILFFSGSINVMAFHVQEKVTPYGDYCSRMSHYGMHKSIIDIKHAEEALKHYYGEKGLKIKIISREGRFIKVEVSNENDVVDTIVFDRRTGRVRSIY